jgi:hypothetical protein
MTQMPLQAALPYDPAQAALLLGSHHALTGRPLLPIVTAETQDQAAQRLYAAPFVVLAHDNSADPLFTYANLAAQRLFEMRWDEIVGLPSRLSAEAPAREERERLLERVAAQGFIDDYTGVRIAKSGRRFRIQRATVWNLVDSSGRRVGQATMFADWVPSD